MAFTTVFGGTTIYPSDASYLALALTADTTLQWPLEASTGNNIAARVIDVTPTGAYSILMPPADETAPGQIITFKNLGASTITIKDNDGGTLLSIAQGLTYTIYLTDNADAAGSWRSFQAGASTAEAQAADLAGYGLVAQGSVLSAAGPVTLFNNDFTLGASNRASVFVWTGGLGTLTLPSASAVGNNWLTSVRNSGEGDLTIAVPGSEEINGTSTLVLRPDDSATIYTDGTDFFTVGYGQQAVFAFDYTSIDLTGQATPYVLSGAELNRIAYQFVGTLTENVQIEMPNTVQQYWVANDTTGGSYTLSIGASGQSPYVEVARGARGIYYCDGTDVIKADTASIALPIAVADGGTGATTAGGALINLGGTTDGIAVFTAASEAAARSAISAAVSGANNDITSLTGLTTPLSVAQGGTGVTTSTGTGAVVRAVSPTLTTPVLGAATATTVNGLTISSTTGTITITNGKTLSASNSLTFAGTDGSTLNIGTGGTLGTAAYVNTGSSGGTVPLLNAANTFSALQKFSLNSGSLPAPASNTVVQAGGADGSGSYNALYGFAGSANFIGVRANTTAAAPSAIADGDILAAFMGAGYYASAYSTAQGAITAQAQEAWTSGARGTRWTFWTTPVGSTAMTARWAMYAAGDLAPVVDATHDLGNSTGRVRSIYGSGAIWTSAPITKTANFTVGTDECSFIVNKSGSSCTITLPDPTTNSGRWLHFRNGTTGQTSVSASSNVIPIDSLTAGTAILSASANNWVALQSNGTSWVTMMSR